MDCLRLILIVLTMGILLSPIPADAEELVTGRYLRAGGKNIEIELGIGSPPPPLIIIVQNLPKDVEVISSKPELKSYDNTKGVAKWLLNKTKPGKMTVSMQLNRPITKEEIDGELRFRDAAGQMVSVALKSD